MSYVGRTPDEERRMLSAIGVTSFEDLLSDLPDAVRLRQPLRTPGPWSEIESRNAFGTWAHANTTDGAVSFMGGGVYDHYVPSAVNALAQRSEFATAYTPYQPEVAQGTLTAIYEFQSMMVELTGMDVSNASLYDGSTAVVEAALLARHQTGRRRVLVAGNLHPHYLAVLRTYLGDDVEVAPDRDGRLTPDDVRGALSDRSACLIYAHPNFFGLLETPGELDQLAHQAGALAIACCDPIALALLEPPGALEGAARADMVVGEAQCLGNPPSFGGPLLGYFTCTNALVRRVPGRIAGETVDRHGRRGFVLTLQTREQHIRREKATSNICTNQGLLALRATIYLALMGREGLREVAERCVQQTHRACELALTVPGYARIHAGSFFREFVLECPVEAAAVVRAGLERGVLPGVDLGQFRPEWKRWLLVAATEQRSDADLERWTETLRHAAGSRG